MTRVSCQRSGWLASAVAGTSACLIALLRWLQPATIDVAPVFVLAALAVGFAVVAVTSEHYA